MASRLDILADLMVMIDATCPDPLDNNPPAEPLESSPTLASQAPSRPLAQVSPTSKTRVGRTRKRAG